MKSLMCFGNTGALPTVFAFYIQFSAFLPVLDYEQGPSPKTLSLLPGVRNFCQKAQMWP
jgi:hypothetical protein